MHSNYSSLFIHNNRLLFVYHTMLIVYQGLYTFCFSRLTHIPHYFKFKQFHLFRRKCVKWATLSSPDLLSSWKHCFPFKQWGFKVYTKYLCILYNSYFRANPFIILLHVWMIYPYVQPFSMCIQYPQRPKEAL